MVRFMLAAVASGSGKTTLTCALLATLKRRGLAPCAFKCGPDYIDPMFHRAVLGVKSHNLDLFFMEENDLQRHFAHCCVGHGAAVCEGVMGYYDGLGGVSDRASGYHVATALDLPVLLVLRPSGSALTLAAQVQGLCRFRKQSHIVGLLLNDCSPLLAGQLAPMLEKETGLPVLGCLPRLPQARFESRHLGLCTATEIQDISQRIDLLAQTLEEQVDVNQLLALCDDGRGESAERSEESEAKKDVRIAVASDKAFSFIYAETVELFSKIGANLVPFSPLKDTALPTGIGGLYLPGGYPELYAKTLSKNSAMLASIRSAVAAGLPTVAECGGFLYLGQSLEDERGARWAMAGILPGQGVRTENLVRFGYAHLTARADSLLFRTGESVPVHEFHYWDSTENGAAFSLEKPLSGRSWQTGFATETLYASFPHIYFAGYPALAERFVAAAKEHTKREEIDHGAS